MKSAFPLTCPPPGSISAMSKLTLYLRLFIRLNIPLDLEKIQCQKLKKKRHTHSLKPSAGSALRGVSI